MACKNFQPALEICMWDYFFMLKTTKLSVFQNFFSPPSKNRFLGLFFTLNHHYRLTVQVSCMKFYMVKYVIFFQLRTKFQLSSSYRSRVITFQSLGTFFKKNAKILKRAIPRLNGSTTCHKILHGQMYDSNLVSCQILSVQLIYKLRYDRSKLCLLFGGKI